MGHDKGNGNSSKNIFSNILNNISEALGKISGFAILLMVIFVTFNVMMRKFFNWSVPGFYEILGLMGAVLYAFGIVYAAIVGQHIVMDLVLNRLPRGARKVCEVIIRIMIVLFCGLFAYAGIGMTLEMLDERTFDIRIPVAPFRFIVVLAFIMLALLILSGKNISKGGEE